MSAAEIVDGPDGMVTLVVSETECRRIIAAIRFAQDIWDGSAADQSAIERVAQHIEAEMRAARARRPVSPERARDEVAQRIRLKLRAVWPKQRVLRARFLKTELKVAGVDSLRDLEVEALEKLEEKVDVLVRSHRGQPSGTGVAAGDPPTPGGPSAADTAATPVPTIVDPLP